MLSVEELLDLEDAVKEELEENLTGILTRLNTAGKLDEFLQLMGMEDLLHIDSGYQVYKTGKIIVIGQSEVKPDVLLAIAKKLGLSKDRFEFYLEYEDAKTFNFRKMQWNVSYSAVLVGPMGHSGTAKGDHSSVISAIEDEPGYPPVIRLGTNGLKITKTDFHNKLSELMEMGKIA